MNSQGYSRRLYLSLTLQFSKAWFSIKDQRSILGFFWSFLNPLMMTGILFLIFSQIKDNRGDINFFLYILSGTVLWNFFIMSTQSATRSLIIRAEMVRNVVFPKEIIVFATVGTFIIQFFFELIILLLIFILFTNQITAYIIFMPFIIALELLIVFAISLFLSSICVFVRDIEHIWNLLTRMGFFIVPIFYSLEDIHGPMRSIVQYNPMTQIIMMLRNILIESSPPNPITFFCLLVFGLCFFTFGMFFFKMIEFKIVERI